MSVDKIKKYLQEYSYLKSIQSLLHWDMETMMPPGAIEDRAQRLSYIQGKIHSHITSKKYDGLLQDFANGRLSAMQKKLLKELKWDYELNHALPLKHVLSLSHAQTIATHAWAIARKNNDWETFKPHLQNLINLKRTETSYYQNKLPYDALIKLHDKEFSSKVISALFDELKVGLLRMIASVNKDQTFTKVADLIGPFSIESQRALSLQVAELFGLPKENSRLDISTHPFSINISPRDQRITTRYTTENIDSLSSTMHEVGHALYELNLPQAWEGTPFQEAVSLSVHESQSRFWENVIGRSREFCQFLHPLMVAHFPQSMKDINADNLFHIFNKSVPGAIRVESSELYYNLHVIIRFEIEEQIFNHSLEASDIPKMWNEKYLSYLDITPKNYAEGVMQDSHWAGGAFGYFPTYTLGNLISGSLHQKMSTEIPSFKQDIKKGNFTLIRQYLIEHIHSKGRSITSKDIVGNLGVGDYIRYLNQKFKG